MGDGKMTKEELQKKIKQLEPWYQKMNLDGIITGRKRDVKQTWKLIEKSFPMNFKSARILDLGCNAGYYSIMAARNGASMVGVEFGPIPFKQAVFLKKYFEDLWDTKLDITYMNKDMSDIDFIKLGKFDYIFAFAVLYHIGNSKFKKGSLESFVEQDRVISSLSKISDKFIVRARQRKRENSVYYNTEYYNAVFEKLGFRPTKTVIEGRGDRSLISYERIEN